MTKIAAQVSLYPLREVHMGKLIADALHVCHQAGLEVQTGPMSTVLVGEVHALFSALEEAFVTACESGPAVLVTTVSNTCPVD